MNTPAIHGIEGVWQRCDDSSLDAGDAFTFVSNRQTIP
jgi:hypothetical protein